jgi:hypothetical protein|tara:strand:- start:870 stop:1040 length:171 start_codon:yes stop_codon:yes gene_type:complete
MAISKSLKRAQDKYRENNKQKGMMRVNVWVPEDNAEELRIIAKEMRQEFKADTVVN